jgi:hypothetical protein
VIAVAIALFLPGPALPSAVDSGQTIAAFIGVHWFGWMFGAWLTFPELVFFLWLTVGLRNVLIRHGAGGGGLPLYMLGGAFGAIAAGLIATTLQVVLGIVPSQELGTVETKILYVAWLVSGVPVLFMPLSVMQFAATCAMRRHALAPAWLAAIGYAGAAASAIATVTAFYSSGIMALNGPIGYLAFFIFALWVVLISLGLINASVPRRSVLS